MKILITILLALFISSNANAQDYTIKDMCIDYEKDIIYHYEQLQYYKEQIDMDRDLNIKWQKRYRETIEFLAKKYHYLDCREELGR